MEKTIICIDYEYGSKGKEIAEILAEKLEYKLYDKEQFMKIARQRGDLERVKDFYEERPINSLLYAIAMNYANYQKEIYPFTMIEEIAAERPCVILGRCASYVMRKDKEAISIFIHACMEDKVSYLMQEEKLSAFQAKEKILERQEQQSAFFKEYTGLEWGNAKNYHLAITTEELSCEKAAEIIIQYKNIMEEKI
jgi:cytidylate kinase